jgi:hypothetical protein
LAELDVKGLAIGPEGIVSFSLRRDKNAAQVGG